MSITPIRDEPEPKADSSSSGGSGGGNGKITDYRLQELERRTSALEDTTKQINETVIEINTKLTGFASSIKELPSKHYVLWYSVGILVVALLSILGHVLIKQFP